VIEIFAAVEIFRFADETNGREHHSHAVRLVSRNVHQELLLLDGMHAAKPEGNDLGIYGRSFGITGGCL